MAHRVLNVWLLASLAATSAGQAVERVQGAVKDCILSVGPLHEGHTQDLRWPTSVQSIPVCRAALSERNMQIPELYLAAGRAFAASATPSEMIEGYELIQKSADMGHAPAQFLTGVLYYNGYLKQTKPTDDFNMRMAEEDKHKAEANRWYIRAAEQHYPQANSLIGYSYFYGDYIPRDKEKAVANLTIAAEAGNPPAQHLLGSMYAEGNGVPRDATKGLELVARAAQAGDLQAQVTLGDLILSGTGMPANRDLAIEWYRSAAAGGSTIAEDRLEKNEVRSQRQEKSHLVRFS